MYQSEFSNHVVGTVLDFWQNLHFSCVLAPEWYLWKSGLILSAVVSMPLSFCAFDNMRADSSGNEVAFYMQTPVLSRCIVYRGYL